MTGTSRVIADHKCCSCKLYKYRGKNMKTKNLITYLRRFVDCIRM